MSKIKKRVVVVFTFKILDIICLMMKKKPEKQEQQKTGGGGVKGWKEMEVSYYKTFYNGFC